jgi:hypothetical protein
MGNGRRQIFIIAEGQEIDGLQGFGRSFFRKPAKQTGMIIFSLVHAAPASKFTQGDEG